MAQVDDGAAAVWGADPTGRWQPLTPSPFPAEHASPSIAGCSAARSSTAGGYGSGRAMAVRR